jgi:hypothetical protein
MLKRKTTKPNVFWYKFDLEGYWVPRLFVDFGFTDFDRDSPMYPKGRFHYKFKSIWIRLGCGFIADKVLHLEIVSNQKQFLKYMHQEWFMTKELLQGALFR